jgi:CDP-diacylglycerol--serine O-phosphatidyltransferase
MKIKFSKSVFPNTFTSLNIFSGFVSIIMASQGNLYFASVLIGIAAVCDALDGIVARMTKSSSKFGVELDSLADVVSFGAAPSFLIYSAYLHQYGWLGIAISSLQLVLGAFRLARFNTQLVGFNKSSFIGLPIPFAALTIASFVFVYYDNTLQTFSFPMNKIIIPLVIITSVLMVSNIKFDTLPKFSKAEFKNKPVFHLFVIAAAVAVAVSEGLLLFFILVSVIVFSIIRQLKKKYLNEEIQ